jgi:hypothetical protein
MAKYIYYITRLDKDGNDIDDGSDTYETVESVELSFYKKCVKTGLVKLYRFQTGEPEFYEGWNGTWMAFEEAY